MGRLRIDDAFVLRWSDRYERDLSEDGAALEMHLFGELAATLRSRGHLTRREFLDVARWKSVRATPRLERNDAKAVREITSLAFAPDASDRVSLLTALSGVGEPIASAILTVWDPHRYTVFDWRATETLRDAGLFRATDGRVTWGLYLAVCRRLADRLVLPDAPISNLRLLDRALWKYSEQKPR